MANSSSHFIVMAMLVMIGIQILSDKMVSAECESQIPKIVSQCSKYVQKSGPKIPPSKGCCQVIKTADVPCLCNHVTREIEKIISMEKVVYVVRTCGLTVKPGSKCGSYTVPPLA